MATEPADRENSSAAIDLTEFKAGWRILILALVGVATSAAVMPLYGFGAMVVPLEEALGWARGDLLATATFLSFGAVFSSQIAGFLNKKYGMRPVALLSMILLPAAFLTMSQLDRIGASVWVLYLLFFLTTFAGIGTLQVTWTQLVNLWFEKNRGLALAIILSGSGMAGLILPPLVTAVIEAWNWRAGFILLALLPLAITLPLTLLWFKAVPRKLLDRALTDDGHEREKPDAVLAIPGISFARGVRHWRFWTINISMVLVASAIIVMVINTVPLLRDSGYSASEAGRMFSAFGVSLVVGRVFVGYLVDRLWAPGVAFVALFLPAVGSFLIGFMDGDVVLVIVGIMLVGIGAGAEFDVAAYLVARYFGMRDYARLFGVQMGVISGGICLAPLWAALLYEATSAYTAVLIVNMVLFTIGSLMLLTLGRYPKLST